MEEEQKEGHRTPAKESGDLAAELALVEPARRAAREKSEEKKGEERGKGSRRKGVKRREKCESQLQIQTNLLVNCMESIEELQNLRDGRAGRVPVTLEQVSEVTVVH